MKSRKTSVVVAFLVALWIFGGLIGLTYDPKGHYNERSRTDDLFGFNVDLSWLLSGQQANFVAVQDTLNFYAKSLSDAKLTSRADWRLHHCCDDLGAESLQGSEKGMYHLATSMNFFHLESHQSIVGWMYKQGWIDFRSHNYRYGIASGRMDLHIPMPTQDGKVLHIEDSKYEVTFFANGWPNQTES
jgi:hypothetical protein